MRAEPRKSFMTRTRTHNANRRRQFQEITELNLELKLFGTMIAIPQSAYSLLHQDATQSHKII